MDKITELASDERRARIALACMAEPGDAVTGGLVWKIGAVETVALLDSQGTLPGVNPVESGLWRKRLASRADAPMIRTVMDAADTRVLDTVMPGDEAWPGGFEALGDRHRWSCGPGVTPGC